MSVLPTIHDLAQRGIGMYRHPRHLSTEEQLDLRRKGFLVRPTGSAFEIVWNEPEAYGLAGEMYRTSMKQCEKDLIQLVTTYAKKGRFDAGVDLWSCMKSVLDRHHLKVRATRDNDIIAAIYWDEDAPLFYNLARGGVRDKVEVLCQNEANQGHLTLQFVPPDPDIWMHIMGEMGLNVQNVDGKTVALSWQTDPPLRQLAQNFHTQKLLQAAAQGDTSTNWIPEPEWGTLWQEKGFRVENQKLHWDHATEGLALQCRILTQPEAQTMLRCAKKGMFYTELENSEFTRKSILETAGFLLEPNDTQLVVSWKKDQPGTCCHALYVTAAAVWQQKLRDLQEQGHACGIGHAELVDMLVKT